MYNTYFSRQPLDEAIKTIASSSKRCLICVTYNPEFIEEDPNYTSCDVLYKSNDLDEFSKQLKFAYAYAKRYAGENCKNSDIPSLENLQETKSNNYTIFIRYKN